MTIDTNLSSLALPADTLGIGHAAGASQVAAVPLKSHDGDQDHDSPDHVQLSDIASRLSEQASSTDPSKLARLQAAYNSGTYNVSPLQIASSIIVDALSN